MCVFNIFFVPLHLGNNKFEIYLVKLSWDSYKNSIKALAFHRSTWQKVFIPIFVRLRASRAQK